MSVHRLDAAARASLIAVLQEELGGYPEITFAYVFGSLLDPVGFRDVDVAIWTRPEADANTDADLTRRLTSRLRLPVDVRRINDAPLPFVFHVLQGEALIIRDELLLADLIERTARQYHDLAPLIRRATREAFAT